MSEFIKWLGDLISEMFPRPAHTVDPKTLPMNQDPVKITPAPVIEPPVTQSSPYRWDTPEHVRHSIRMMCDSAGLNFNDKQVITACIYQESNFYPLAKGRLNTDGTQDFGLCQYNTGKNSKGVPYWIGPGAAFASIDEVLHSPEKNVRIMINEYKAGGISRWSSYKTGAYKQWLKYVNTPVPAAGHY